MCRLIFALSLALAVPLHAQSDYTHTIGQVGPVQFINHHPACNPFAMAFDPLTLGGRGVHAPRIVFHAAYPVLNEGIHWTLTKAHVPSRIVSVITTVGLPLTPHLIQAYRGLKGGGTYQLNLYDWFYDFHNRNLPAFSRRDVATWAAGDVLLSCFARP